MTTARRIRLPAHLACAALLLGATMLKADDEYQKIIYWRVGDPAPAFDLKDEAGAVWKSSQHYGKKYVVIYFYMGDFMNDCTKEALAYRDVYGQIAAQGAEVVGISGDDAVNHQLFKLKHHLKQTLLADDKGEVGKAFGLAWSGGGEWTITDEGKEVRLRRGITESRWTWIVGKDGKVIYKDMNVNPEDDAKRVLKFLTDLNTTLSSSPK